MQALQTNLDGKSKQYKDPALTHLFLMNNIHYMVRSVRRFVSYNFVQTCASLFTQICVVTSLLSDLRPRICQEMIGCKDTGGLCSSMQINTKGTLGERCSFFFHIVSIVYFFANYNYDLLILFLLFMSIEKFKHFLIFLYSGSHCLLLWTLEVYFIMSNYDCPHTNTLLLLFLCL